MFDLGAVSSAVLAAVLLACGGFSGWRLGVSMRDRGLEMRSQAADINWLRAALTDSEKRCAQQAEWMNAMEAELISVRAELPSIDTPLSEKRLCVARNAGGADARDHAAP